MQEPSSTSRMPARILVAGRALLLLSVILLSVNTSASGQWLPRGPYAKSIRALAAAPDNPNVIFAGAFGWGVFKSTDGGATWANHDLGLSNKYIRAIAARSSLVVLCGSNDGISRSTDGGVTWTPVLVTAFSVRTLIYDPATGHWFAGTYGDNLYRSLDDGQAWTQLTVSDPLSGEVLHRIRAGVSIGADSLYVGGSIGDIGAGGALFASYNGGLNWTQVQQGIGVRSSVTALAASPNSPASSFIFGTAARGMYKSTDGGLTITNINAGGTLNPLPDSNVDACAFSSGFRITGTEATSAVYLRSLGDTTTGWLASSGLPGVPHAPNALLSYAGGAGLLAGLEESGVYRSLDSGRTFTPSSNGLMNTDVRGLVFTATGRAVAGTGFGDQIFYSDDGGATWTRSTMSSANSVFQLARATDGTLYAAQYATGVLKSVDNGATWTKTDSVAINRFVRAVAIDPLNTAVVYAGTGNGVFKTANAGLTWTAANDGTIPFSTSIRSVAASPWSPGLVLAGSDIAFLYRSTDGGATWTQRDSTSGFLPLDAFIRTIQFHPLQPGVVFIGADDGHVYKSSDDGLTWNLVVNLPGGSSVREVMPDPGNTNRLFAATYGKGVFVTEDGGTHWSSLNDGLADLHLSTLTIRPGSSPPELWAGSGEGGAFRRSYTGPGADQKPTLTGPASAAVVAGGAFNLTYIASDPDLADTMTFSASGPGSFNAIAAYAPDTATFTWNTVLADSLASPYTLTVIVQDGRGAADTIVTTLAVPAPGAYKVGDVNQDQVINASDIIYLVTYVFKGGPPPLPEVAAGDANCNGSIASADIIFLVGHVFKGGPAPGC